MTRVSVAERFRLSVLIERRAFRSLVGADQRASLDALALHLGHHRPAGHRAAGPAHRRRHPRQRNLRRPLCLCRQGGDLRPAFAVRDDAAVRRVGGRPAELCLAAPSARRRLGHHPRQCALADRRLDQHPGPLASARLAHRHSLAPHPVLAVPGAVRAAGRRRALLSPLHALRCHGRCVSCAARSTSRATDCRGCRR